MNGNTVIQLDASESDFRSWVARWLNANGVEWTRGKPVDAGSAANLGEITTRYAVVETPDLKRRFRLLVKITGTGGITSVLLAALQTEWPDAAELTADEWVYSLDGSIWPEDTTTQGGTGETPEDIEKALVPLKGKPEYWPELERLVRAYWQTNGKGALPITGKGAKWTVEKISGFNRSYIYQKTGLGEKSRHE